MAALLVAPVFGQGSKQIVLPVAEYAYQHQDSTKWELMELTADNLTDYQLVEKANSEKVMKATSHNATSGLIYKVDINPKEYSVIGWSWKINGILEEGNMYSKNGDNYPARIYIMFEYDECKLNLIEQIKYSTLQAFMSKKYPTPCHQLCVG